MTFSCPGCGRIAAFVPATCPDCGHVAESAAQAAPPAWFVHAKGRLVGPLSRAELAGLLAAGMVGPADFIGGHGLEGWVVAGVAAQALGLEPGPAAPTNASPRKPAVPVPDPAKPPPAAPPANATAPRKSGWRFVAIWLVGLLALQFFLMPKNVLGAHPPFAVFLANVAARFALLAIACWVVVAPFAYLARRRLPGARGPLMAMSMVTLALVGWRVTHPEAPNPQLPARHIAGGERVEVRQDPTAAWEARAAAEREALMAFATSPPEAETPQPATTQTPAAAGTASPRGTARAPSTGQPAATPFDWYAPAYALSAARDWPRLLEHSLAWIEADRQSSSAWTFKGIALVELGRGDEGVAALEHALALNPENTKALFHLGLRAMNQNDYRRGLGWFERAAQVEDESWTWNNVGWANQRLGEYDEAIAAFERAVKLDVHNQIAWRNLYITYHAGGYPDRAGEVAGREREALRR
jgi:hypothetical protein